MLMQTKRSSDVLNYNSGTFDNYYQKEPEMTRCIS